MSFVSIWFCVIGTVYVLNSIVNTMLKIYTIFNDEEEAKEMSEEIKRSLYS